MLTWQELAQQRIGIVGYGREGRAAHNALIRHAPSTQVTILDANTLKTPPKTAELVAPYTDLEQELLQLDIAILSPGVSVYQPAIERAQEQGVRITSGTTLWRANRTMTTPIIAVSGTKGKSTASALIAHLLRERGASVAYGGNSGHPVLDLNEEGTDYTVLELSSAQLATFEGALNMGVLTNLFSEHLDWHTTQEHYEQDKLTLLRCANTWVIPEDFDPAAHKLSPNEHTVHKFNAPKTPHTTTLAGEHNQRNIEAALTAIAALGIPQEDVLPHIASFKGLPHRLQQLGERDGILYVNDSISTTPQSTIAALNALQARPITLILGGLDRGIDYTPLIQALNNGAAANVILLPELAERLTQDLTTQNVHTAQTLGEAVTLAQEHTQPGGTILLSPAAASYNTHTNFEERGNEFATRGGFSRNT